MDEQTIQQPVNDTGHEPTWDATADGAVYSNEAEEPLQTEAPEQSEPDKLGDNDLGLNADGELEFGEGFFGNIAEAEQEKPPEAQPTQPTQPNYYSDEELSNTPYTQWDRGRLPPEVQKYFDIATKQFQASQPRPQPQQIQYHPLPPEFVEPKQYDFRELASESKKLACEKLGIDAEDFDDYEQEHRAAANLAMSELLSKRTDEIRAYQQTKAEWDDNQAFQAALARQPDFPQFNAWYMRKVQEVGATPQQVDEGLMNVARQNGNRFGLIKQIVGGWYQDFRQETARQQQIQLVKPQTQPQRKKPPVLEGSGSTEYTEGYRLNLKELGSMSPDEQAQAFIKLGLV